MATSAGAEIMLIITAVLVGLLLVIAVSMVTGASPPPPAGVAHGAAGTARNGTGGSIAPSPAMAATGSGSWPGTGSGGNGGPFAFVGAQYGALWRIPPTANNSLGVGYCVMEDVDGEGIVTEQPDPAAWDADEMAMAAALMSTFGGDRVVPYGIDDVGSYDAATGEWQHPQLLGGGEYTRRRQVAVNFGVRMFLDDVSPSGVASGRKLARDTAVVDGSGGEFAALRNGYEMANYMAGVAETQHAVGNVRAEIVWGTPGGVAPTMPGTYPVEVRVSDGTGKRVGMVPVLQLSAVGIGDSRSIAAVAHVDNRADVPADVARWNAAAATGWPVWGMNGQLTSDARFAVDTDPLTADVADPSGVAHFDVTIGAGADAGRAVGWELAFHVQAPTADVHLYAGSGIQGQVTFDGIPQSTSVHQAYVPPPPTGRLLIRKVLDDADVQGDRDMSGFEFEVTHASTHEASRLTTDPAGTTPPFEGVTGQYQIAEVSHPAWAAGLFDGGPLTFTLEPAEPGADPVALTYTNDVPPAEITTAASDAVDGDREVSLDDGEAEVKDAVGYCGLVPGTDYTLDGSIQVVIDSTRVVPSGVAATTKFTPATACGTVDVHFHVPADSTLRDHRGVVFEELALASTRKVVARHADPNDPAQTLTFVPPAVATTTVPPTTAPPTTAPPTTAPPTTAPPATVPAGASEPPPPSTAPPTAPPSTAPPPTPATQMRPRPRLARTGSATTYPAIDVGIALVAVGLFLVTGTRRGVHRRGRQGSGNVHGWTLEELADPRPPSLPGTPDSSGRRWSAGWVRRMRQAIRHRRS